MVEALCRGISPTSSQPELRPREREVVWLLARGLDDTEIAAQLGVNSLTVRFHIDNVLHKLGATNRSEAVDAALLHHLLVGSSVPSDRNWQRDAVSLDPRGDR
jgi:DNA-binding NarL/FixJ family response regulator